jgi:ribosome-associated protein
VEKKADGLLVLDLRGRSDITDWFIICHGASDRQVLAIAEHVEGEISRRSGKRASHVEGRPLGEWILMDYVDFIVHVFTDDRREFYRLERLWGDAPRVKVEPEAETSAEDSRSRSRRSAR